MSTDKITTIVGAIGAAATAAQPVLNATQGAMHQSDYFNLIGAVCMAVWAVFTNKGAPNAK